MKKARFCTVGLCIVAALCVLIPSAVFAGGSKEEAVTLRVAAFEGGYGVEWVNETARLLEERHPGLTVEVTTDPRIWEKVQPMFVAGNPPDVVAPGWLFDHWGAISEGQFKPLESFLKTNADGTSTPWIDTFADGTFTAATYEGHIWYIPLFPSFYGWWYNKTVWDKHGWKPPKTWDEAFKLFDSMKKAGVAPIANQGQYPMYLTYPYLTEFIARLGGPQRMEACINLAPGSWTDPKVVESFTFLKRLIDNYFQQGHLGMNHLQSQAEVMVGKAGLIACGSWFPKEQEQVWPEGDEIRAMPLPSFPDSPYPQNVYNKDHDSALLWVISSATTHEELAVEYLKLLTSEKMAKYTVENTGNPTTYKGSSKWLPDNKFGRAVASCTQYYENAAYTIAKRETLELWYPRLEKTLEDNLALMEQGKATPAQVCNAVQAIADELRNDPNVIKHKFSFK
jgi:N-acetylglucosamine transport system substrate-binding protein